MKHWRSVLLLLGAVFCLSVTRAQAQCPEGQPCLCAGDCNGDGEVGIVELQGCVNGFLGDPSCLACDSNLNDEVGIVDLQGAVNSFLDSSTCPPTTLAKIRVGSTSGARGAQVSLPISLAAQVNDLVTIAPLRLNFNSNALTFVNCASTLTSKTAVAESPGTGVASVVLYADPFAAPPQSLTAIPAGTVMNCTFGIKAAAPTGPSPVTFVSAGLADSALHDINAAGEDGGVSIQ
jgi:hypothetical protein